jgi:hypothetical protein
MMTDTAAGLLEVDTRTDRDVPIRVCIVTGILIPTDKHVTHPSRKLSSENRRCDKNLGPTSRSSSRNRT